MVMHGLFFFYKHSLFYKPTQDSYKKKTKYSNLTSRSSTARAGLRTYVGVGLG